jgi:hypothetical protein
LKHFPKLPTAPSRSRLALLTFGLACSLIAEPAVVSSPSGTVAISIDAVGGRAIYSVTSRDGRRYSTRRWVSVLKALPAWIARYAPPTFAVLSSFTSCFL